MTARSQLIGLMARTSRLYKMTLNAVLAENGIDLSSEMCGLLVELWREDTRSQQELALTLKKDKGGITRLVKSLYRRDLVYPETDPSDRRRKKICLTSKGKALKETIAPLLHKLRGAVLQELSDTEIKTMEKLLDRMVGNMKDFL